MINKNTPEYVSITQFKDMLSRYNRFKEFNGREPRVVFIYSGGGPSVSLETFKDMCKRYNQFLEENRREPRIVYVTPPEPPVPEEVREMRRVLGEFKTATQLYTLVSRRCKYKFYYNDQTPNREALKKMVTDGINCTDACQLFKPVIEGLVYSVRIEHVKVKCNDNKWYGHYFLRVAGKELASVSLPPERWTVWDYVSATKTGRPLGVPCCTAGFQHLGWGIVGPVYDK